MVLKPTKMGISEIQPDLITHAMTYRNSMDIWDQQISPNLTLCIRFYTDWSLYWSLNKTFKTNGDLTKFSFLIYDQIQIKWSNKIIKGRYHKTIVETLMGWQWLEYSGIDRRYWYLSPRGCLLLWNLFYLHHLHVFSSVLRERFVTWQWSQIVKFGVGQLIKLESFMDIWETTLFKEPTS